MAPVSGRGADGDAYLIAFVRAGSLSCRMSPLPGPLAGSTSHEAGGQMARAGSEDPEGGEEGQLHSRSLYRSQSLREQNSREHNQSLGVI